MTQMIELVEKDKKTQMGKTQDSLGSCLAGRELESLDDPLVLSCPTHHKSKTRFCFDLSWRFRSQKFNKLKVQGMKKTAPKNIIIQKLKISNKDK